MLVGGGSGIVVAIGAAVAVASGYFHDFTSINCYSRPFIHLSDPSLIWF